MPMWEAPGGRVNPGASGGGCSLWLVVLVLVVAGVVAYLVLG